MLLAIDRSKPFNPAEFLGQGFSIWRGPADGGGMEGEGEQDSRSLALQEVDFSKVLLETCFEGEETWITGEEKLRRLKASGHIRLDARIGQALYEEEGQRTLRWLHDTHGIRYVDFMGTILRSPDGDRDVLFLYRGDDGGWDRDYYYLECGWRAHDFSAALASTP